MPLDLKKITVKWYFFTKERHLSRKIHSAEEHLTYRPCYQMTQEIYSAQLLCCPDQSHICCIPHVPSNLLPRQTRSGNHREREANCLSELMVSSAAPCLIKQEWGSGRHKSTPMLQNRLRNENTGIWTYSWATGPQNLCRRGSGTVPWRSTN